MNDIGVKIESPKELSGISPAPETDIDNEVDPLSIEDPDVGTAKDPLNVEDTVGTEVKPEVCDENAKDDNLSEKHSNNTDAVPAEDIKGKIL